ncbi:MAG: hypothetical protein JO316_13805 [Abitibacteriaceae bacterium]|nr:hypothetical protein [Abditibacteriaceae bacterium]
MPGIESECQTERSKTIARWCGIFILAALVYQQQVQGIVTLSRTGFLSLFGAALLINLFHSFYLFRAGACSSFYKYISVGLDLMLLTFLISNSGLNQSPYFFVYFVLLVSNCIRYGLVMSLYIAVLVNVFYPIALSLGPHQLQPSVVGGEGLKLLAFWGVALYGGAVSARIRRQVYEIAAYEDTIAELRAALRKPAATAPGAAPMDEPLEQTDNNPAIAEPKPQPAEHLRLLNNEAEWIKGLAPVGVVLLLIALALTFFAPHVLWFLLYPLLIVGAFAALATTAAWLLRYLRL